MSFLLKIVEGPNKGAEIALVEGVAVTLGKGDDCDIVLADLTMPDAPLRIEASADGVLVDGEPIESLSVRTFGATSFAVGPADMPWGELKWPKAAAEEGAHAAEESRSEAPRAAPDGKDGDRRAEGEGESDGSTPPDEGSRRHAGCLIFLVVLALLLVVFGCLVWFFSDRIKGSERFGWIYETGRGWCSRMLGDSRQGGQSDSSGTADISAIVAKYGLTLSESNGHVRISGNLKTRRERLSATAEVYQAKPGVDLDISDDESFRAAAEDALFTLTEGALKVLAATNRVLTIAGALPSPVKLKKTIEALNADLKRLDNVDVSHVVISRMVAESHGNDAVSDETPLSIFTPMRSRKAKKAASTLPVCGILTTPYPCLVMRDGRRLMEGAAIGDGVILEIGADSVTLTNATGRFTWKP